MFIYKGGEGGCMYTRRWRCLEELRGLFSREGRGKSVFSELGEGGGRKKGDKD
jgi:hypothetical protein